MIRYTYLSAILLIVIVLGLQIIIYHKKVKKAFQEKRWDVLPKYIFYKHAICGIVFFASYYYRDSLKYIIGSGDLFSDRRKEFIEYCEQKGYGLGEARTYLLLRELILHKCPPQYMLKETKNPLANALLSCARGDVDSYLAEILAHPSEDDNLRTLCAVLAIKMGYADIPIDEKMRSSAYANLLEGGNA